MLCVTNDTTTPAYDARGNLLHETITGTVAAGAKTARSFQYDPRNRLTGQNGLGTDDASWTLDKLGNWTAFTEAGLTQNRTVSLDNEYTQIDAAAVTHDVNGNLAAWNGRLFYYDWANRLVRIEENSAVVASYTYDALGRRVVRAAAGTATRYIHSGAQVVEEYENPGPGFALARRYLLGPGLDQPILMDKVGGPGAGPYYYLRNRQGSVLALAAVDGSVAESYTYSAYGRQRLFDNAGTEIPLSAVGNPYGYTGRRLDPESGLLHYRNRYHSPELGRFLTRDPAGFVDGPNLYAYVRSNPLAFVDPWGLAARDSDGFMVKAGKWAAGLGADVLDFVLPDAIVYGVEANGGFVGAMGGGGQIVENYRSGEVSTFYYYSGSVGLQLGDFSGQAGVIFNLEENKGYEGGSHSLAASGPVFGAAIAVSGNTLLDGKDDGASIKKGPVSITGSAGMGFLPASGRIAESEYSEPTTIPGLSPNTITTPGKVMQFSHDVLKWLEAHSQ